MKNNFLILVKIEALKFLSSFNTRGKKARKMPLFYLVILIALLIVGASFGYSFLIIHPYVKMGVDTSFAVTMFAGVASLAVFMTSLSQARTIYIGDDYDMLSSLPIKKRDIVASKVFTLYLIELAFSVIILIPHGIIQIAFANNLYCFLISLLLAFTLPIVPIAIAMILSLLITLATSKFKSANFVFVILYAIVIAGIATMSAIMNRMTDAAAVSGFSTIGSIIKWINPSYTLIELTFTGSKLFILIYLGINIVVVLLSVLFIVIFFDKLHEIVSSASMKKKYVRKDLKVKTQNKVLLRLEFKRLFNSKIYFVNGIMGSLMCILGSTIYLVTFSNAISSASAEAQPMMRILFIPMFIICSALIVGLANPITGAINIEGKTFWISKSLPIDYKKSMWSKILFSWVLTLPATLIASTIAVCFYHDNVWEILFSYFIPFTYSILNSFIGLIIALKHPKLKWSSETEAVKNSASVLIGLLINFGIWIVLGTAFIVLTVLFPFASIYMYIGLFALFVISIIPCFIYLKKNYSKTIYEIEDL